MTPTESFLKEHHAHWNALRETKMFKDLLHLMDAVSPAKNLPNDAQTMLHLAPVMINQIKGWDLAVSFAATLGDIEVEVPEPQVDYSQPMVVGQ